MTEKWCYFFAAGESEGNIKMKEILGGKGAGLAEMASIGIPIPPGFTIKTSGCVAYNNNQGIPKDMLDEIQKNLTRLETKMGKKLGDPTNPLLVSVRSGAAVSMPGMMDTVLNLGLNQKTLDGIIKKTNNPRFGWDAYRRFVQMYSQIVMDMDHARFEQILDNFKKSKGYKSDQDFTVEDLQAIVVQQKAYYKEVQKTDFPEDVQFQLISAIEAVFRSWNCARAVAYRKINCITGLLGTAVNVQTMVFGNMGQTSGTGVAFTRNTINGERKVWGEFLMNAQGEDVVAGIRNPEDIHNLKNYLPEAYQQFLDICEKLEKHFREMQDMEFTIQETTLYMLQTRTGKRTAMSALKIAVDMVNEGLIKPEDAITRIDANALNQLLHPQFDPEACEKANKLGKGLAASPGAAVGEVCFTSNKAKLLKEQGKKIILVRLETSPEDIEGMHSSQGILTARGGMTSHAAVVARGMGKCCVCGCSDITEIDDEHKFYMIMNGKTIKEGDWISLNGTTGEVYEGKVGMKEADTSNEYFATLMKWADQFRTLKVRTNADTPVDAQKAVEFGAEGIGLCRTEHMFFAGERIFAMREMILATNLQGRVHALDKLFKFQIEDFKGLFKAMAGRPVTIRLLDPPLHEFLPTEEKDIHELAKEMKIEYQTLKNKIDELHEFNPMLGWRGCRLGISFPEITEMQTRAILEAAIEYDVTAEIMVPLVGFYNELMNQKAIIVKTAAEVEQRLKKKPKYLFGTMIEVPRGALVAYELAKDAEFFSFGTNDLTQMGCGFSRDDAGKFIKDYLDIGIFDKDPFQAIDRQGIGQLMKIACAGGKKTRPDIKLGICGEHGGEPSSVEFCHMIGLTYVSCSPFRVPIARLAAAQAALKHKYGDELNKL